MKGRKSITDYSSHIEPLDRFNKLNINEQNELLRDILKDAYGGRNKVKSETLLKIENLAKEKDEKIIKLENSITVENDGKDLIFTFSRTKVLPILIFYIGLLVLLSSAATFSYLQEMKMSKLNVDINGDGIPDINIDTDNDEIADVNIDINDDDKPERNIDYMGNHVPTFNVIKEDGTLFNKMNQDLDGDGVCDLNCDTDNDGWPDLNIDLDGDGKADMFIDVDNSGYPNLNIDVNGDGVCDIECDTDGDLKCNKYCLGSETLKYLGYGEVKDNKNFVGTTIPAISVIGEEIECNNLYPTDQPQDNAKKECTTKLTVKNLSDIDVDYQVSMNVLENTYTSNNFKYKMTGTNGGGVFNSYVTVPKSGESNVFESVTIRPGVTQEYTISFILEGTNEVQNYDANRVFNGNFKVEIK